VDQACSYFFFRAGDFFAVFFGADLFVAVFLVAAFFAVFFAAGFFAADFLAADFLAAVFFFAAPAGRYAHASISTAQPNGNCFTPIVERAGRADPKPAAYDSLNCGKVSMSVRKHIVFAMSLTVAPIVANCALRFTTACAV